jgi:probable F420-dependent oxidoreductase
MSHESSSRGRDLPRVGIGLPILGRHASPDAMVTVATAAERLGFSSVSTFDRILMPAARGWENAYGLPDHPAFDALESLTWIAAQTTRIRLMTGVLIGPYQPPVVLARRFATLDRLSGGRVDAGLGAGWLPEEFAAVGVPLENRGARFEDHVLAMKACWASDPVEHDGRFYPIAPSKIGPKPISQIPVLIGAVAPAAIERAARIGDGFIIGFRDWESTIAQIEQYRNAGGTGRIVVRAGPLLPHELIPEPDRTWSVATFVDDLTAAEEHGVDEVVWDLNIIELSPERQVEAFESVAAQLAARSSR